MLDSTDYKALYEYVTIISPEYTKEQLAERTADYVYRTLGAENVIVMIESVTHARHERADHLSVVQDIVKQAIAMKTPITINHIGSDFTLSKNPIAKTMNGSAYCVPLATTIGILGAITIITRTPFKEKNNYVQELAQQLSRIYMTKRTLEGARTTAITDQLTGLYMKSYFQDILNHEIEKAKARELPTTLLLYDLDDFKKYNDTKGHIAGDELLQALGRIIRETLPEAIHCRYGGEEFATLMVGTPQGEGKEKAEMIRIAIQQKLGETTSIGTVTSINSTLAPITMLKESDNALYEAKRKGKNRVEQYISLDKALGIINTENL